MRHPGRGPGLVGHNPVRLIGYRKLLDDTAFLRMSREDLCSINECRVVHFMFHDRVSFGGSLIAIAVLYHVTQIITTTVSANGIASCSSAGRARYNRAKLAQCSPQVA